MQSQNVIIISAEADFAVALAEQVRQELSLACEVASEIPAGGAAVVVAHAPGQYDCPVVVIPPAPVRMHALLADIRAAARRRSGGVVLRSGYVLEPRQKTLTHTSGQAVTLTDKEVQLLQCLAAADGVGMSRDQLLRQVWGIEVPMDTHTLETHIYRLRGKCRELAGEELIEAIESGYKLK